MLTQGMENRLLKSRWLMLAMLGLLHAALLVGVHNTWAYPLLFAHLGLFLLWQPLWRGEREIGRRALVVMTLVVAIAMLWLNWWAIAFWLIGLFGLVGARVFAFRDRGSRLVYLLVMVYLLALLLLWVVPNLFTAQDTMEVGRTLIWYVLPVLLVLIAVLPGEVVAAENSQTMDFIYSLLLFMLLTLVILGSLAFMTLAHINYLEGLLRTLFLMGIVLLALGGLWTPRFGFGGLQMMLSRYLLNVGTPFESWLEELADAAQHESDATNYLAHATALLGTLPWLSGMTWQTPSGDGQIGHFSEHAVAIHEADLHLTLYAKQALNPAVLLHMHLLTRLVGYFYQAKQREQSLRDITRLQAVYEIGSRLTHDLKNMLQSLLSLTSIAQSREERAQQLLQQQLPLLTKRIEQTLSKLKQPQVEDETPLLSLAAWWDAARLRNQHQQIQWNAPEAMPDSMVPAALFDCVLDNLLANALRKKQSRIDIHITVEIHFGLITGNARRASDIAGKSLLRLSVCDDGEPVPEAIAANLLRNVVISKQGLGVGLYQAAQWAEQLDYNLRLSSNQAGSVCFELRG